MGTIFPFSMSHPVSSRLSHLQSSFCCSCFCGHVGFSLWVYGSICGCGSAYLWWWAAALVGGRGGVLCSGHWQVIIYKPHHKLLACVFCSARVRVCGSVQPHIFVHCFQAGARYSWSICLVTVESPVFLITPGPLIACCAQPCVFPNLIRGLVEMQFCVWGGLAAKRPILSACLLLDFSYLEVVFTTLGAMDLEFYYLFIYPH